MMTSVIRFLTSTRTAIALLLLLALQTILFVAGTEPIGILKKLTLHKGPQSLPFLVTLLLLFFNQLGASVLRLFKMRKTRAVEEEEVPPTPGWTGDGEFDELEEQKPRKKLLVPSRPYAESRTSLKTLLRFGNAMSLLETLGFQVKEMREDDNGGDIVEVRQGPGTRLFTFFLHLGAVALIGAFLYSLGFAPTQTRTLWPGVNSNLGIKLNSPLAKWMHKLKLRKSDKVEYPTFSLKLNKVTSEFQPRYQIVRPKDPVKRWMDQINGNFLKPKELQWKALPLYRQTGLTASVVAGKEEQNLTLEHGNARVLGPYRLALTGVALTLELSQNGIAKPLSSDKPLKLADGSTLHVLHFAKGLLRSGKAISQPCLGLQQKKKGKVLWSQCVAQNAPFTVAKTSFQWTQEPRVGVVVRYQNPVSFTLYIGALFLFLFGFIGFWWPRRYHLTLTWHKKQSELVIEGSGLGAAPHTLAYGIEKTLHFPPEWLPSQPPPPRNSGTPGSGPAPTGGTGARPVQSKPAPVAPATQGQQRPAPRTQPQAQSPAVPAPPARPQAQVRKPAPQQAQNTQPQARPQPQAVQRPATQKQPAQRPATQAHQRPAPQGQQRPVQGQQRPVATQKQPAQRPVPQGQQRPATQKQPAPRPAGQKPVQRPAQKPAGAPTQKTQAAPAAKKKVTPPPPASPSRPKIESRGQATKPAPKGPAVQQTKPTAKPAPVKKPAPPAATPKKTEPSVKPVAQKIAPPPKPTIPDVKPVGEDASKPAPKPSVSQRAKEQTAPAPFRPKPEGGAKPATKPAEGSTSKTQVTAKPKTLNVGAGQKMNRQTDEFAASAITKVVAESSGQKKPDLSKQSGGTKARSTRPNMGPTPVRDPKHMMTPVPRSNTSAMGSTSSGAKTQKKEPPKAPKQNKLDVDSLFEGLGSEKTEVKPGGKPREDKAILQELDIDALFKDFDDNIDKK